MKKLAALTLSIFLTYGTALADTPKDADAQPAAAAKAGKAAAAKAKKGASPEAAAFAAELQELRQAIQSQQEQLQLLKEELAKRDRQIDEARETAASANARALEANSKAAEAVTASTAVKSEAATLNTTVSDLKVSNEALRTTVATAAAQEKKAEEAGPAAIHYKGITITPGGFIEAATVTRTRAESAGINTDFKDIPFPSNALSKLSETNFEARQTRATALFEGTIGQAKLTGYYEGDFLAAAVTSNNRQSNSYGFRQRQVWGQLALDNGWQFTGGQMWTLATENRKSIQNRQEDLPMMIDPQYVVGFTWARQYAFRAVKDFGGKFAVGVSVEGPQATLGGRGFTSFSLTSATGGVTATQNFFINAPGQGAGLLNFVDGFNTALVAGQGASYTVNKAPDIIIKAAADPGFGHYELFGIISTFRNRVYPCAVAGTNTTNPTPPAVPITVNCPVTGTLARSSAGAFNDTRVGGGLGASALFSAFNKKVDFGVKAVAGDGIGRYGSAQLADETFRPDGTAALIRTAHALGRVEFHPNPKLDVYLYGGSEYAWRAAYTGYTVITATSTPAIPASGAQPAYPATTTTLINLNGIGGYGSPFANNSGCQTGAFNSGELPPTGSFTPSTGGTCAGDIRIITEGTIGFWHKFYSGPKGGMRWGVAYSYITKSGWSGNGTLPPGTPGISPKAVDNMIWTSFRYYIP